jgi:hypothetical protein
MFNKAWGLTQSGRPEELPFAHAPTIVSASSIDQSRNLLFAQKLVDSLANVPEIQDILKRPRQQLCRLDVCLHVGLPFSHLGGADVEDKSHGLRIFSVISTKHGILPNLATLQVKMFERR